MRGTPWYWCSSMMYHSTEWSRSRNQSLLKFIWNLKRVIARYHIQILDSGPYHHKTGHWQRWTVVQIIRSESVDPCILRITSRMRINPNKFGSRMRQIAVGAYLPPWPTTKCYHKLRNEWTILAVDKCWSPSRVWVNDQKMNGNGLTSHRRMNSN